MQRRAIHLRHSTMSPMQPSLPEPHFPPALDFHADTRFSPYQDCNDIEKALIQPRRSLGACTTLSLDRSSITTPKHDTEQQKYTETLTSKQYPRILRHLRYTLLTVYNRIFTTVIILNFIPLLFILQQDDISLDTLATAASTNFLLAIFIRQDFVINGIFRTAWLVPWSVPFRVRQWIAGCYSYGGVHSGAAIAGTAWWIAFSIICTIRMADKKVYSVPILTTTWAILILLIGIILLAYPGLRKRHHNVFEITHRFLGWTSILLFWAQLMLVTVHAAPSAQFGTSLLKTPTFWNLSLMTVLVLHPWLRLRTWTFRPTVLSPHAVRLRFTNRVHKFSCLSISTSPLREWHPFATFPSSFENTITRSETSLIISAAGDWTRSIIHQAQHLERQRQKLGLETTPEMTFWVKPTPIPGVLSLTTLFPRILLITTGSGIGPCLSSLLDRPQNQFIRLVWSTRSPLATYGADLLASVYAADPDALIIDTDEVGRPDLVRMAYGLWKDTRAEAVFVLSNETVTRKVVYGLRGRGVLAVGPIFDS